MFHAYYIVITTCLSYTLYHFYAFSGTNLLTRCHSASSCFLLSFYFRKSILEIFSELDANLTDLFLDRDGAAARRTEPGATLGRPAGPRRGPGWGRAPRPPPHLGWPPTPPLRLYIASDAKTLGEEANFHEEFRSAAAIDDKFRGTESLFRHAVGTGNCPRTHLHQLHRHLHRRC